MDYYINTDILIDKIKEKGIKYKYIAVQLNITPFTFSKKMKNIVEFKISEVNKISEILGLTVEERKQIFVCLFQTLKEN